MVEILNLIEALSDQSSEIRLIFEKSLSETRIKELANIIIDLENGMICFYVF